MLLENDDSLGTTRSTELSIVQVMVFPFWAKCGVSLLSTRMNIRVLSKVYEAIESLAFHRVIALLRTDRNHEQKLVLTRLFALPPVSVSRIRGFWTFSEYPLYLSFNSPLLSIVHRNSRIHNKRAIFCVSGAFTGDYLRL